MKTWKECSRQEIVDELEKAKRLTWISDQGYWSKVGLMEYWSEQLIKYDDQETPPSQQT